MKKKKKRGPYQMVPFEERKRLVLQHNEKGVSLRKLEAQSGIPFSSIEYWVNYVKHNGMDAFETRYSSITYPMGRPKKKTLEEMTELERLRYENAYLKAENALLKKVRALVEEREARLKEIGRKPSKN